MTADFTFFPKRWGLTRPDSNIDQRAASTLLRQLFVNLPFSKALSCAAGEPAVARTADGQAGQGLFSRAIRTELPEGLVRRRFHRGGACAG